MPLNEKNDPEMSYRRGYQPRAHFRKIRKTFFTRVQCGLGNRSGERATNFAGSFPPVKSIAGGPREATRGASIELALTP